LVSGIRCSSGSSLTSQKGNREEAWTDVGSGVPQGSLLGPILFLLFVNDMPRVVENTSLAIFADDSKCYKVINQESDIVNLQRDLDGLSTWSVSKRG